MIRCRPLRTVYVDWNNSGDEDGSLSHPFDTVQEGIDAAGHGTTISIETGTYTESPTFDKRGRVVARNGPSVIRRP
ncbi:MAG: hypothetical protein QUU85_19235 [Candidatus Eisenbacteria bacterium]|nr:hypothetical protein [Candidatus Eisenbacteria bacterium]